MRSIYPVITFDSLAEFLAEAAGRYISARILNGSRVYYFDGLKPTFSFNVDVCGVGGRNHGRQYYRRSRFHDPEDVDITFEREDVRQITIHEDQAAHRIHVQCARFTCELTIVK